jgi:hypothetical protein
MQAKKVNGFNEGGHPNGIAACHSIIVNFILKVKEIF